jgi:hypothetical protein
VDFNDADIRLCIVQIPTQIPDENAPHIDSMILCQTVMNVVMGERVKP